MAADTDGQWIQAYLVFRECRLQSCLPAFSRLLIPGVGSPDEETLSLQVLAVLPKALDHGLHGGAHAPYLPVGIQLSALDAQHGLDAQHTAEGRPGYGTVRWSDLKSGLEDQFLGFQSL